MFHHRLKYSTKICNLQICFNVLIFVKIMFAVYFKVCWCLILLYYPIFSKPKNILSKIHLLLTPDREHINVFENVPIIGFKKGKSLLVRAKVPPLKTEEGFCGPCNKPRCEICKHITKTHQFPSTKCIYSIRPQNLNCAFKM